MLNPSIDVTALAESEERYRRILETAAEGVWVLDAKNRTTFVNGRMSDLLGRGSGEMVGRDACEFFADEQEAEVAERRLAERRAGRRTEADHFLLDADGGRVAVRIAATPLFEEDGTYSGSLKMVSDIRDRLAAEKEAEALRGQLHQSQKLEGIGQLAGGIAHDFNNLLAVILTYAAFVEEGLGDRRDLQADVREIRRAAERAGVLTHQLLVFSRQDHAQIERFDFSTVVAEMEELLRRTLGGQLELVVMTDAKAPAVDIGRGQIEQIVLNLAVNARDALGDGGRLAILAGPVELDIGAARRPGNLPPGLYSRLTVTDNGSGMSPEVIARVLEPFFTTKPVGKGSGLGLSTVYGIVEQAGGHVGVHSIAGTGTTVEVYLPAATGAVPSAPPARPTGLRATAFAVDGCTPRRTMRRA